jgi:methyl-accepting chemotaxis protein
MKLGASFSHLTLRIKVLVVTVAVFVPAMLVGTGYFLYGTYWLTVTTALNGLMNFVDAKQQGVIRFIGQNEKLAKQLAALTDDAGPAIARRYFATIVATDVFKLEDHPFKEEILSGKRRIATMKVYHAIDYVRDGMIVASSNPEREGKPFTQKLNLAPGYSNVWEDDKTPVLSFGAKTKDGGQVLVHADARMLTNIVNGEIGNLEGDMGAYYLAGVGKTFDYYIVDENNRLITEARTRPGQMLKGQGSVYPWQLTQKKVDVVCSKDGTYRTNAKCTTGCQEAMGFYKGPTGKEMLGVSMPFYDSGWTIVVEQEADELLGQMRNLLMQVFVIAGVLVVGAVVAYMYLSKRLITGPLTDFTNAIQSMAGADGSFNLKVRYHDGRDDEVGLLAKAFDGLVDSLDRVVSDIRRSNSELAGSVRQLADTSAAVADSSRRQAGIVGEIITAMRHVQQSAEEVARLSETTRDASQADLAKAGEGETVTRDVAREIDTIAGSVAAASATVAALDQRSQEISGIVNVIREIADQTNLLALNAAIEAARAGEQGRGFAVVADEVRKLAERTSKSTADISALIDANSSEVHQAVAAMQAAHASAQKGTDLMNRVETAFGDIAASIREMAAQVGAISGAADQQRLTVTEAARLLDQVASTAEANRAAMDETIGIVRSLETMASNLSASVEHFHV